MGSPFSIPKVTCEKCVGLASGDSSWTFHITLVEISNFQSLSALARLGDLLRDRLLVSWISDLGGLEDWTYGFAFPCLSLLWNKISCSSKISRLSSNSPCGRGWLELLNLLLPPPSNRISGMFHGAWLSVALGREQSSESCPCWTCTLPTELCPQSLDLTGDPTGVLVAVWEPVCLELWSLGNSWIIFWILRVWSVNSSSKKDTHMSTRAVHCYCLKPFHFLLFWLRNFVYIWWQLLADFSLGFCPSVRAISLFWDTELFEGFASPLNPPSLYLTSIPLQTWSHCLLNCRHYITIW